MGELSLGRRDGQRKGEEQPQCLASPHPRSLRSRKRECPSAEISETDYVQAPLHYQCHQSPLQESIMSSAQQHQAAEQPCLNKQDPVTEEKHAKTTNVSLKNVTVKVIEVQEETMVTNPKNEDGLPAKKKQRMCMWGLTEKEQSHFLQTQKRENGQNDPERAEKQICNNKTGLVAQEEIISSPSLPSSLSIPADRVSEQAEIKLQSSHCGGDDRAETEVHTAVTTSDRTSALCEPGCSTGKSCEAERGIVPGPEQTGDTKSDPPAEEELLANQEQKELEECTADNMAENPQEQMKDGGDGSAVVGQSPRFYSNPMHSEETDERDAIKATPLQVNSVTRTRDEEREELTCDAGDGDRAEAGASSTDTWSRFSCGSVELCEAAMPPGGLERKDSCDPDDKPGAGPSTLNTMHPQTRDTTASFGSGSLDYVSDSQLNTIVLIEEEVMETEHDLGSPDCHDATDLICGLIRELSSLNRKVMATERELKNLRRSRNSSRSSIR